MKKKLLKVIFLSVLLFVFFSPVITHAEYGTDCPIDSTDPNCQPPSLGDFQTMVVSLIGTGYALIGVVFMGILIFNGLIYLLGYIEDAKYILGATIEDAQKRMTQWVVGFLMVIISYPLINTFMQGIVGESECYSKLNNPTVQFIFPTVCTKTLLPTPTPTPTTTPNLNSNPKSPPKEDLASCANFGASIKGDPNQICVNNCLATDEQYQEINTGSATYPSITCNCSTKKCYKVP